MKFWTMNITDKSLIGKCQVAHKHAFNWQLEKKEGSH